MKNSVKKIGYLLLVLILSAQFVCGAYAAENTVSYDVDELAKVTLILNKLGVVELQDETEIWQNKSVSRGEFAEMIYKAFKMGTTGSELYFTDVPFDHWAYKAVTALTEAGYVSVSEDRLFNPDNVITYAEALKIVLSAANYNVYADYNGGFPRGYIAAASRMKLSVTGSDTSEMTIAAAVSLIYDVMSMGFYEPQYYSGDGAVPYKESDDIIFAVLWDTYIERDYLKAYYGAGYEASVEDESDVVIGDVKYKLYDSVNLEDMFLNEVEFIYQKQDDDTAEIIYIKDTEDGDDVIINAEYINGFNSAGYTLSYYKNDKLVDKTLSRGCAVILNGAEYTGSVEEVINEFVQGGKKGTVRLKSYKNSGIDTIIIKSYRDFVAGYANVSASKMYNKFDSTDCIDMNEYKHVVVRSIDGGKSTLDFSTLPAVFTVAEAKDKSAIEIVVCNEKISGKVSKVQGDLNDKYITLADKEYKLDYVLYKNMFVDENNSEKSMAGLIGAEYQIYIDKFGCVAYMTGLSDGDGFSLAYIIDGVINQDVFNEEVTVKMLTETSEVIKYTIKEKIVIDGTTYKFNKANTVIEALNKGSLNTKMTAESGHIASQIIRFKADEDKVIKEIDTAFVGEIENEDNTLTLVAGDGKTKEAYKETGAMKKFGRKTLYDATNTKVFGIPYTNDSGQLIILSDGSSVLSGEITIKIRSNAYVDTVITDKNGNPATPDDSMYVTGTPGGLESDGTYPILAYKYNSETPYVDVMMYSYENYAVPLENVMVEEIAEMYSDDGETADMLIGWERGKKVSYEIADNSDISDLEFGDIVYVWKDMSGKKLSFVKKIYDYSEDKFINRPYTQAENRVYVDYIWAHEYGNTNSVTGVFEPGYYSYNTLSKGVVLEKIGNTMRWDWDGNYRNFEETFDFSNIPLVIVDKNARRNKVKVGTVADVPDYKTVGENEAAKIVLNADRGRGVCAFVYINN